MLSELLRDIELISIIGDKNILVSDITFDSRNVSPQAMFVALVGSSRDGHNYIGTAIDSGASSVLCSVMPNAFIKGVTYICVDDTSRAMASIVNKFFGSPSSGLKLIGITGTNGKTSTATLLYNLFTNLGHKCGLISTINYVICGKESASTHTTPDIITLNKMFREMVDYGCKYCFMEVSSHAIDQNRIDGLVFDIALFTNITHDHLDYHKNFAEYIRVKKSLFDNLPKHGIAIYNSDDKNGAVMVQNCRANIKSFSLRSLSNYRCRVVEEHLDGMLLEIDRQDIWVSFIGRFNAYNLLGVYAVACELGVDRSTALLQLSSLTPVRGRFDTIPMNNSSIAIVDYAHTPDALENVLDTITKIKHAGQTVITVIGCGGDRDKSKRPIMASIAVNMSDFTIITSDNPRTENPDAIISDMVSGLNGEDKGRFITIASRAEAIKMAVILACKSPKSILLVAGKGHESYQEVCGVRTHFDDKEHITNNL